MNSHLKSVGNIFRSLGFLALPLVLTACMSSSKEEDTPLTEQVQDEVSIKADRSYLDQERQNIPAEIKKANDELAFDLEQMGQIKEDPNKIRERFQTKVRKARDKFRNQLAKKRENFSKEERKQREAFLKAQAKEREAFKGKKADREKTKEFYADQDLKRKDHFQASKEKRSEFEEETRGQAKEFDELMRERTKQFNDQLRIYTQRYQEQKRCEQRGDCGAGTSSSGAGIPAKAKTYDMREFDAMKKVPATPLGTTPTDQ